MLPGEQKTKPDHCSAQGSRIRFCFHFKWHREEGKINTNSELFWQVSCSWAWWERACAPRLLRKGRGDLARGSRSSLMQPHWQPGRFALEGLATYPGFPKPCPPG